MLFRSTLSQFTVFTLSPGQEIFLLTRVKSGGNQPGKTFSLGIYDHVKFLEMRRYGIYIEGALLGVLLAQVREAGAACLLVTHSEAAAARADRVLHLTPTGIR